MLLILLFFEDEAKRSNFDEHYFFSKSFAFLLKLLPLVRPAKSRKKASFLRNLKVCAVTNSAFSVEMYLK
jgi:hypothetical protein